MNIIENQNFPSERDLYGSDGVWLKGCTFQGEEDGESALKESRHIRLDDCYMDLRYPLWHDTDVELNRVTTTANCRAALWYTAGVRITDCTLGGIKALRECQDITMDNVRVTSPEFGWKCRGITVKGSEIEGEYPFFLSRDLRLNDVRLKGKYSFQYVENMVIENSVFDTKDAFWHSKNVTVRDSVIKGEYLAWYAEGLTLERCRIIGTQPLCYCRDLKLIDCEMVDADLAFEYSDVEATLRGEVVSVKNPRSGHITVDRIGEILLTPDSVYPCDCVIEQTGR
ncbi:MAG: DUF3737 family protein [Acutalibacteraceae bacterium]|jgi:hypothetical protein